MHDCMPETMGKVTAILGRLRALGVPPTTLLVVPGRDWSPAHIATLKQLADAGHSLAAHGWRHHTRPRTLFHRLHALLISRDVAEHLALDAAGIAHLLRRSHGWFQRHGLPVPEFYVPPAWALGAIRAEDLARSPFRLIETTSGLLVRGGTGQAFRLRKLPLTGFEADTAWRAAFLRRWNQSQRRQALRNGTPLRISIHPDDPDLRLADQLEALLQEPWNFLPYATMMDTPP